MREVIAAKIGSRATVYRVQEHLDRAEDLREAP